MARKVLAEVSEEIQAYTDECIRKERELDKKHHQKIDMLTAEREQEKEREGLWILIGGISAGCAFTFLLFGLEFWLVVSIIVFIVSAFNLKSAMQNQEDINEKIKDSTLQFGRDYFKRSSEHYKVAKEMRQRFDMEKEKAGIAERVKSD